MPLTSNSRRGVSQTAPAGARVAHRLEVFVGKASRTRSIPKPGLPNLPVYSLLVISRRLSPFYLGEKDGACYALPVLVVTTHCRPLLIPGRPDQLQRRIGNEKRPSTLKSTSSPAAILAAFALWFRSMGVCPTCRNRHNRLRRVCSGAGHHRLRRRVYCL